MRIALLVDGDNVSPKYLPAIMREIQQRGVCSIKRIYGDWTTPNMNGWLGYLRSSIALDRFNNLEMAKMQRIVQ